jgi:molybdopterin/thiamine biosynthesis adenylyltransferase/molybdopterin converting factor small subunit
MKVTLHYWAQVKQAAGVAREEFEVDAPCTAQALVVLAAQKHGDPLRRFLLGSDGTPHRHLMLIIGDRHVAWEEPVALEGGEEITLLPPISGGSDRRPLTDAEKQIYEWQMWVPDFGEEGQEKLKGASVLISRCGGLGGVVAYELAAAGVGRLVIAHAGNVKPSDLNRQLLMTHDALGTSRVESAARRLAELNPNIEIVPVAENINESNAARLVGDVDLVVDCAPLFEERFLLNREAVQQNKPLVDCAMYELEAQITTIAPGVTPCLSCLYPTEPDKWKREFPVFGAVSGAVGCLGALEAIKVLAEVGEPLHGVLLLCDLRSMQFRRVRISQRPECPICGP